MVFADFVDDEMDFFEVGIFAAGAVGRVRKHGDFGLETGILFESFGGIFDDNVELVFRREFVDATVGESEGAVAFLTNKTA